MIQEAMKMIQEATKERDALKECIRMILAANRSSDDSELSAPVAKKKKE